MFSKGFFLKGGPSDLGEKKYKNAKKSSVYSQNVLNFIHKTPVVQSYLTTREIKDLLPSRSTLTGNTVYFYMRSPLIYKLKIQTQLQTYEASNEDIKENNYISVML